SNRPRIQKSSSGREERGRIAPWAASRPAATRGKGKTGHVWTTPSSASSPPWLRPRSLRPFLEESNRNRSTANRERERGRDEKKRKGAERQWSPNSRGGLCNYSIKRYARN
ncbi:hypothetical protein B296_00038638, partial [Ensete ventricosum]